MYFDFISAGRIVFGPGRAAEAGNLAAAFGDRCLLIHGRSPGVETVRASLDAAGVSVVALRGPGGEPDESDVDAAVPQAREAGAAVVVAVGGGSVLDFAKAVAALAPQHENAPVRDYLEGVGTGRTLQQPPLSVIACPTTAGTGSEVTKNSVISSRAARFKKSLRDARMVPAVALVDPDLQAGAPRDVRVASGLDALTQNIEAFLSRRATPITEALALRGVAAAAQGLRLLMRGDETAAQEPMALAALLSGLALANGGLGAAHGIAQSLGIHGVSHGLACAVALPWVTARSASEAALAGKFAALRQALDEKDKDAAPDDAAQRVVAWLWETSTMLGVPRLRDLVETYSDLPALDENGLALLARGAQGNSLSGNPVTLDEAAVAHLLRQMRDADRPAVEAFGAAAARTSDHASA